MQKKIFNIIIVLVITSVAFIAGYSISKSSTFDDITSQQTTKETNNDSANENTKQESQSDVQTKNLSNTTSKKTTSDKSSSKTTKSQSSSSTKNTQKEATKLVYLDIYYRNDCSYCTKLFKFLNSLDDSTKSKLVITKHNIYDEYAQFKDTVKKFDNGKNIGTPYVVFNNQKTIAGYSKNLESKYLEYINELSN